jgi:hypothetical protein
MKADLLARRGPLDAMPQSDESRWVMFQLAWATELESALERNAVPRTLPVHLFAAQVGDLMAVTFPLEIYSQIGLDVRHHFEPHPPIIAAYTNGLLGYAPTDLAIAQGGYGPAGSYRFFPHLLTPLARGSADLLTRVAVELLGHGLETRDTKKNRSFN